MRLVPQSLGTQERPPTLCAAPGGRPAREDHRQCNPLNTTTENPKDLRARLYRYRDRVRHVARSRVRDCGRRKVALTVGLSIRGSDAFFSGVLRCNSAWECPTCMAAIRAKYAGHVVKAVNAHRELHGEHSVLMLSLTTRHSFGDDLESLRRGVADAYRKFVRGAPWKRFKAAVGMVGYIRGADQPTYGKNGWHPHLHVLFLVKDAEAAEAHQGWLAKRWQDSIEATLGPDHVPELDRGCDLRSCKKAAYITKLGLEVAGGFKEAKGGNRGPLHILADYCETSDPKSLALWMQYCEGMRGARMLTWSRGLKKLYGVEEDDAEGEEEPDEPTLIYEFDPDEWREFSTIPDGPLMLLESVENVSLDMAHEIASETVRLLLQHQWRLRKKKKVPRGDPEPLARAG